MNILLIHQNFPGQFKFLAPVLVEQGHDVRALTRKDGTVTLRRKDGRMGQSPSSGGEGWDSHSHPGIMRLFQQ